MNRLSRPRTFKRRGPAVSWEMQVLVNDRWETLGFEELGGFVPYRYERKEDAMACLVRMFPRTHRTATRAVRAVPLGACA
jgi:hypothetical protein